jgi:hypothetical protein
MAWKPMRLHTSAIRTLQEPAAQSRVRHAPLPGGYPAAQAAGPCVADDSRPAGSRSNGGAFVSVPAIDGDRQGAADLPHPDVGEPSESLYEDGDRDALDRVEVDRAALRDRIVRGFQDDLAGERPDGRRARRDECATKARDCDVSGQHDDGAAASHRELAPPQLAASRRRAQEAAAASRNDARSPHVSGSSSGCSS